MKCMKIRCILYRNNKAVIDLDGIFVRASAFNFALETHFLTEANLEMFIDIKQKIPL